MNSVTQISLDIYFLFCSIGKHHDDIKPKCLATETYGTTLCIGPLLTICVSFHQMTHKDLASLQTPKHFHACMSSVQMAYSSGMLTLKPC